MNNKQIEIYTDIVGDTISKLQRVGLRQAEGIVLWLGAQHDGVVRVEEAYEPEYHSEKDYFRIPPTGMARLLSYLGDSGLHIIAQVHTHPEEAFHSRADDTWAIVRHLGALSLVLPYFAKHTSIENFLTEAAVFCLAENGQWQLVVGSHVVEAIAII